MNCPACDGNLHEITVSGVRVDLCKGGCGGIWFDAHELRKFDEPHEYAGETLLEAERDVSLKVDHSRRRTCPRCEQPAIMMRHFYSIKHEVEVDECPRCGGYWLDYGELADIRTQYQTQEEREKAAEEYFSDIMDKELGEMRHESQEKLRKAERIAHIFRFLCPSYYIRGNQPWGAH